MRKKLLALVAVGLMGTATMTACDDSDQTSDTGSSTTTGTGKARVGVILPDTSSSARWEANDAKFLRAAFAAGGVPVDIQNAKGDKANFEKIADTMINTGVKVLIIVNLDAASARSVLQKARAKRIPTIDYDRLSLNGGADYYVSFDNVEVGRFQGLGLKKCLAALNVKNPVVAELNGSPTDNNATLFKQGYDKILQPLYDNAEYTKGPDQSVPEWDNDESGVIFSQMLDQRPDINGVLVANDGMAGAVLKVLKKKGLNGKIPITGQDATVEGLQNILSGDQCVTVYKAIQPEAQAAANLAIQLFKGQKPVVDGKLKDPESGAYVPFVSLKPESIEIDTVKNVVADGFVTKKDLCTAAYAQLCKDHGVK
jgi:D-xylose transport system substrate-binding protein